MAQETKFKVLERFAPQFEPEGGGTQCPKSTFNQKLGNFA
jgi:hypothetical protein